MTLNGNSDESNGYNSVVKNGTVANANYIKSVIPPIGSVLPWLKSLTNTPTLPDGWVECDGSTISDSDSPYDGITIPDLNGGTHRMLRGASTSGGTGGSDTYDNIAHTHTLQFSSVAAGSGGSGAASGYGGMVTSSSGSGTGDNKPAYYEVVFIMRIK